MRFKDQVPGQALLLLLTALVVWAVGAVYTVRFNPEVRFLAQMAQLQAQYAAVMEQTHGHKVMVLGGSSAMFSIIGEQLLAQHSLPGVNFGLNARVGAQVMMERAVAQARKGDTLVLAFEPALLTGEIEPPVAGIQLSYALQHPGWVHAPMLAGERIGLFSALLSLRPGGSHWLILASKLFTHHPLYTYRVADAAPSGWNHTTLRGPLVSEGMTSQRLSPSVRRYLQSLRQCTQGQGIQLAYSLPWRWVLPEQASALQKQNAEFLRNVASVIPVLKDPELGARTDAKDFSDTAWHLTETSSQVRTAQLGEQLQAWQVWTPEELAQVTAELAPVGR